MRRRQGVLVIKAGVDQLGLGIGSLGTAGFGAYSLKRVLDTPYDPEVPRCNPTRRSPSQNHVCNVLAGAQLKQRAKLDVCSRLE